MEQILFNANVSKGSRFDQIYIPRKLKGKIEPGDQVEIRLLSKSISLCYSKGLKKLSEFKENLVLHVFKEIRQFAIKKNQALESIFIVGSFLFEQVQYNDIDIVIATAEKMPEEEIKKLHERLGEKFRKKFHIVNMPRKILESLLAYCPMTRAMLSAYISDNTNHITTNDKILNKNHIEFLLMMPEDLLTTTLSSKIFLDNLRRLVTIELFLDNKDLGYHNMIKTQQAALGPELYARMKSNDLLFEDEIEEVRKIFKEKIKAIRKKLK